MSEANEFARARDEARRFFTLSRVGSLTALVYLAACVGFARGPEVYTRAGREIVTWLLVLPLLFLFWKGHRLLGARAVNDDGAGVSVAGVSDDGRAARAGVLFGALFCLLAFLTVPF